MITVCVTYLLESIKWKALKIHAPLGRNGQQSKIVSLHYNLHTTYGQQTCAFQSAMKHIAGAVPASLQKLWFNPPCTCQKWYCLQYQWLHIKSSEFNTNCCGFCQSSGCHWCLPKEFSPPLPAPSTRPGWTPFCTCPFPAAPGAAWTPCAVGWEDTRIRIVRGFL